MNTNPVNKGEQINSLKKLQNCALSSYRHTVFARLKTVVVNKLLRIIQ